MGDQSPPTRIRLDGRTTWAKRAKHLELQFLAALGSAATGWQRLQCRQAALLAVACEQATTRFVAGDATVTPDDISRLTSTARRCLVDTIGIGPREAGSSEPAIDVLGLLRSKYGE